MPESQDLVRKLTIKTNVAKRYDSGIRPDAHCRYAKEVASYEREYEMQRAKIEAMDESECPHERAKQVEVQEENRQMVVECRDKHAAALEDLREFLSRHPTDEFDNALRAEAQSLANSAVH